MKAIGGILNFLVVTLAVFVLYVLRFKSETLPMELKKAVIVVAPHTSNWDFFILAMIKLKHNWKISWCAKQQMFRFPFTKFLKAVGGMPIDRSKGNSFVGISVSNFEQNENLLLGLTPEGTRKYRDYWKTGFHHIAQQANVPIVFYALDYKKRLGHVVHVMNTTTIEEDFKIINRIYAESQAKHPSQFSKVAIKEGALVANDLKE